MSSALQSLLFDFQQNDYASVALLIAIVYDYVITLPKEIEYIWSKTWTWVTMLFVLVRYVGIWDIVLFFLGEIIFTLYSWTFLIYLGAADFVMVLRIWAMYQQSRLILGILLTTFGLEIIITLAFTSNSHYTSESTLHILDYSLCVLRSAHPVWTDVVAIFQLVHGTTLCTLAIIQFVRQSFQMYHATKKWQLNRYMSLLVKQGIFYFFAIFLFNFISVMATYGKLPRRGWAVIPLFILGNVPMYTLTPRFIISIRALYARDLEGRVNGGTGIDSGFGLSFGGRDAVGTAMVFAEVEQSEELEDLQELPRDAGMTVQGAV